ncbi:hypothetical protein pmac_cds_176 [Pandoravirus macleodensis]|uniref:Uncharacterized protein n=1 Tax=Pandoravirus macleodensis TaxID=2107707 RepID=A0A2U7UEK3_9VIRU|nr:hypothetical protein pmac_cds_176 [Pandoravirus macleodensis]AVK76864.1 hypothetical protein pmac_cds_176 [Pandoravirus macleodensis]UMO79458.1 hypothetical protein [Pandoravirus aubagnensis]
MDAYYAVVAAVPSAVLCPALEHTGPQEAQALPLFVAGLCGCVTLAGLWALGRRQKRRRRARQAALAEVPDCAVENTADTMCTKTVVVRSCDAQHDQAATKPIVSTTFTTTALPGNVAQNEPASTSEIPDGTACGPTDTLCESGDVPLPAAASGTDLNPRLLMMLARDVSVHASWAPAYDEQDA